MSIIRVCHDRNNPYVIINKKAIEEPELSWAAKGLWCYLMGRPNDWRPSVAHLTKTFKGKGCGRDAVYNLLNELIDAGYCIREQKCDEHGKFTHVEYVILEHKELKEKVPLPENPFTEKPDTEKPTLISNEEEISNESNSNKDAAAAPLKNAYSENEYIQASIEEFNFNDDEWKRFRELGESQLKEQKKLDTEQKIKSFEILDLVEIFAYVNLHVQEMGSKFSVYSAGLSAYNRARASKKIANPTGFVIAEIKKRLNKMQR